MTTPGTVALCGTKENGHYRQMVCARVCVCVCVCVYTGASTGQATGPREINNGLGFISLGSDTHTHVVLITGAYADRRARTHTHTHTHTHTSGFPMSCLQGGHC